MMPVNGSYYPIKKKKKKERHYERRDVEEDKVSPALYEWLPVSRLWNLCIMALCGFEAGFTLESLTDLEATNSPVLSVPANCPS